MFRGDQLAPRLTSASRLQQVLAGLQTTSSGVQGRFGAYALGSHFQPIFSLSHCRVIGHEALMRAKNSLGDPVSPLAVLNACSASSLRDCDNLSRIVHLANYSFETHTDQWLFLNVHPSTLLGRAEPEIDQMIDELAQHFGFDTRQIVLEILEGSVPHTEKLESLVKLARSKRFLIALDDFGAGHSNFDRVWSLQPDIVKLDRTLAVRAANNAAQQRVVAQMVSLLHECGSLVLMEGIETAQEALIAMDADVDFVQGYYFGRPSPLTVPMSHIPQELAGLRARMVEFRERTRDLTRRQVSPYINALECAAKVLSQGASPDVACASFLQLPHADICYVLSQDGHQIGPVIRAQAGKRTSLDAYAPLRDAAGANWSRRPYFQSAVDAPNLVHITRPYRTFQGMHLCSTASCAYWCQQGDQRGGMHILCGDILTDLYE